MVIFHKKEKERKRKVLSYIREQEETRTKMKAAGLNLPYINISMSPIELDALLLTSWQEAQKGSFVPFQKKGKRIGMAIVDPKNKECLKAIHQLKDKGFSIKIFLCSESSLSSGLKTYKKIRPFRREIIGKIKISTSHLEEIQSRVKNIIDLKKELEDTKNRESTWIIEVILASSIEVGASDIHIEPETKEVKLRYRIDGILHNVFAFRGSAYKVLLSRLKLLAGLKLNICASPQDGRFSIFVKEKSIEVRVSVVPGEYGEDIVMRILNPNMILSIDELGFAPWHEKIIFEQLKKPTGMILTCGPTGSGKTTTLYACLKTIANPKVKIITIEHPIEYHLKGIAQTQVDDKKGYDFATALRSILRQDPDVILIGEIRDRETADTALQASLTGHLVFSTLHTNDAAGIVPRLIEMGANPTSIAPSLNLAIAQRLLRRICTNCAKAIVPSKDLMSLFQKNLKNVPEDIKPEFSKLKIFKPQGCKKCHKTGYHGRIGIYEMFQISERIEEIILSYPSISKMRKAAVEEGMITMQQDGLLKTLRGETTVEELQRITGLLV